MSFDFTSIRSRYEDGKTTPLDVVRASLDRIDQDRRDDVWISLADKEQLERKAAKLGATPIAGMPLWGMPFSVKDNIDVAGLPTTAACPAFEYRPEQSARVVARLEAAGAICIGKTNLDQFATGLNGTRSPYGACGSAFDKEMVSGGSSSGSAVSVALHQVAFSIGTDTGGSGRIPAGLNNVIGLKPTLGTLSTAGLVPNCRTLDCPSVFALNIDDALDVARVALEKDLSDASLRDDVARAAFDVGEASSNLKILVPAAAQIEVFGNAEAGTLFATAVAGIARLGFAAQNVDLAPFLEAGSLVFDGPWICDRDASIGAFVQSHQADVLAETRAILGNAAQWSGTDTFAAIDRLRKLRAHARCALGTNGVLVVPTVTPLYSIVEMLADPLVRNTQHGHYSYFVNPLDLCAISIPAGFYSTGMPFGITLIAAAFGDSKVAALASSIAGHFQIKAGVER